MLTALHINDFTLVANKELEFRPGLTALTGETGAGKSILLDALALALGEKADADKVRTGAERAEVSASFDISRLASARDWLIQADLGEQECLLRRVVTAEGRSRHYVNGRSVTLGQLRELAGHLIDIHSQHEHQSLLKTASHRRLLDGCCQNAQQGGRAQQVAESFKAWQNLNTQCLAVKNSSEELNARYQLLSYQVQELDELALEEAELERLEQRQKQLANAEQIAQTTQQVYELCSGGDESIEQQLHAAIVRLEQLAVKPAALLEAQSMLQSALIQVEEAGAVLSRANDDGDSDAYELPEVEERLSAIYDVARKHRVAPEDLYSLHTSLSEELSGLSSGDEQLEQLEAQCALALEAYQQSAAKLSSARRKGAKQLAKEINAQLAKLAMGKASFEISLSSLSEPSRHGAESVEFLISTVPGKPARALAKVASGGELSRISLAIVVVTAKTSVTPTLVFDEVDVGIGGATGDVVGQMLRELGESAQVLCVTHLAQVASKAHHHYRVEKTLSKKAASTDISELDQQQKIEEVARMMGGDITSEQSLAHAKEMLTAV